MSQSTDKHYQAPVIQDIPIENSTDYKCGWLLKWFRLIIIEYPKKNQFNNYLLSYFNFDREKKSFQSTNIKTLYESALKYSNSCRTRWHTFFETLWNHPFIIKLFDREIPHNTQVRGHPQGFSYIIDIIADNIFHKVFYGIDILPPITIRSADGVLLTMDEIQIFTKKGLKII